ncbi:exopolysaccharide biosynthesis protein [Rickettsiales bacterium]|nr:exopolysaccharide biosynthesis protein [Rickettsiales bacterium]
MQNNPPRRLSKVLDDAINALEGDKVSFSALIEQLGTRTYGILLVLLTLPNAIPVSGVLGISALTGLLMIIFSFQMALGIDKPKLPKFIAKKEIKKATLLKALGVVSPYLEKIEPYIKPRLVILSSSTALKLMGWVIVVFCLVILIPFPFTNFVPALAIFLIGLGMLEKDGALAIIGVVVGIVFCTVLFMAMSEITQRLLNIL